MKSTYSYKKGEEIYGEGTAATYCYQVVNGAICVSIKLTNGRRQIGAFYFPGDIFGLEPSLRYRWSANAIVKATTVRRVKRKALLRKAETNSSFARGVRSIAERDLLHAEDHRILLGRLTARERVAAFFLQMNNRIGVNGEIELPMSRTDIGDYLGLTIETVSREISKLSDEGVLRRPAGNPRWVRGVTLLRPESLRAMLPTLYPRSIYRPSAKMLFGRFSLLRLDRLTAADFSIRPAKCFALQCHRVGPTAASKGLMMIRTLAVATLIAMVTLPAYAANEFETAGAMVERYAKGGDDLLLLRLYIRGIGEGVSISNASLETQGRAKLYCPPQSVGLVDAQYVAIMASFLKKVPAAKTAPPSVVLLEALQIAFPCNGK